MYSMFRHIPSIFSKRNPIHLTFFVTRRCNARCPFCFYLEAEESPLTQTKEMTLSEIERFSKNMGRIFWLAFSGGEVFLRKDLVQICQIFYRNNKPPVILLVSNGMKPDLINEYVREIVKTCPKSTIALKLSLDGIGAMHDQLRGVSGAYEKVMQTYLKLRPLTKKYNNFELGFNTVFCRENQHHVKELIDHVLTLDGIQNHSLSLVRGNLRDKSLLDVDINLYQSLSDYIEQQFTRKEQPIYRAFWGKLKAAQDVLQRQLILRTKQEKRQVIPCYAGRLSLVVQENGDIYPCEILNEKMGNLRDDDVNYDVNRLLNTRHSKQITADIKAKKCHCTHECNFIINTIFNPTLYWRWLRHYISLFKPTKKHVPEQEVIIFKTKVD